MKKKSCCRNELKLNLTFPGFGVRELNYSILSWRVITTPPQTIVFRTKNSSESMKNSNMIVALLRFLQAYT